MSIVDQKKSKLESSLGQWPFSVLKTKGHGILNTHRHIYFTSKGNAEYMWVKDSKLKYLDWGQILSKSN